MTGPEEIVEFWFADAATAPEASRARMDFWFQSNPDADAQIRERFGAAVVAASAGELSAWRGQPHGCLALIILLDQFSRNIYRGTPAAFENDAKALSISEHVVVSGHLDDLAIIEQVFTLVPFEHSEELSVQRRGVTEIESLLEHSPDEWKPSVEEFLGYFRQHMRTIDQFGRFPHRNEILQRVSTESELSYLRGGGETYGQSAAGGG